MGYPQTYQPTRPFVARLGLSGGHVQTIASFLLPRGIRVPAPEERLVEVAPGVKVMCHCNWQQDRTRALTVIVVHGLEGSSDSQYMLGITAKALAEGMNVIRFNQRNCGGTEDLAPVLYHSGLSSDVAAVAREVVAHDGVTRLALVGFSMGGNLVLKTAGEWGTDGPVQLKAVAVCCPALDLAASANALHEPSNRLYEGYFLWQLRRRLARKARLFPGHFDLGRLHGVRSLRDFDDRVTAYYSGFAGAVDYYDRASAAHVVGRIAVPVLVIHAANDPFVKITPETRQKLASNRNIAYIEAPDGGHCAFVGRRGHAGDDGFWAEREIVNFLGKF